MKASAAIARERLPSALRPWRTWLGWFDIELAAHLGDLLLQLSELIGPAPAIASRAALEPDGLDDLRARGSYERLLSSEWLLADEIPEEFLRRAASSEHLFMSPRLRGATVQRSVVAIFDCGPLQLGSARLAHIAAWILLARRAAESGGVLRWGVLQAPGTLRAAESVAELHALLSARQFGIGGAAQVVDWRAAIGELEGETETWWIGAGVAVDRPPAAQRERELKLRTSLNAKVLDVVLHVGPQTRGTDLALPSDRAATALLRGQFISVSATMQRPAIRNSKVQRISLVKAPLFGVPAGFVAVTTLEDHAMQVFALPQSGQKHLATPRLQQWSATRPPVAMMLSGRQAGAICSDAAGLHFWQVQGFGTRPRPEARQFEASIATANWLPMIRLANGTVQRVCVIDRAGRLAAWDGPNGKHGRTRSSSSQPGLPVVFDKQVLAMIQLGNDCVSYVYERDGTLVLRELEVQGIPSDSRRLCSTSGTEARAFIAAVIKPTGRGRLAVGAVAFCESSRDELWQLFYSIDAMHGLNLSEGTRSVEILLAPGERAFGVVVGLDGDMAGLVVRGTDRHSLHLVTEMSRVLLHSGAGKIAQCTVCPRTGLIAMLTVDRDLFVHDARLNQPVFAVRDADIYKNERDDA